MSTQKLLDVVNAIGSRLRHGLPVRLVVGCKLIELVDTDRICVPARNDELAENQRPLPLEGDYEALSNWPAEACDIQYHTDKSMIFIHSHVSVDGLSMIIKSEQGWMLDPNAVNAVL